MFEVFVSVKHFYVPNLKKSRDRYLSVCFLMPLRGFILAAKEVNEISSSHMIIVSHYGDPKSTGKVADPGT